MGRKRDEGSRGVTRVGNGDGGYTATGPADYDRTGRYRQSAGFGSATQLGGQGYGGAYGQGFGGASYREELGYEYEPARRPNTELRRPSTGDRTRDPDAVSVRAPAAAGPMPPSAPPAAARPAPA